MRELRLLSNNSRNGQSADCRFCGTEIRGSWAARSPVLFPVVGWTRGGTARVASHSYPLSLHGFAKDCRFEVVAGGKQSVRLALRDDRTTQELYPFSFLLESEYRLSVASLVVEIVVTNTGAGPMPFAAGLHPGFVGHCREGKATRIPLSSNARKGRKCL